MKKTSFNLVSTGCNKEIVDLSHEISREYRFPVKGHLMPQDVVRIMHPVAIHRCEEHHIVIDRENVRHDIPRTWIEIEICVTEGCNII
jgi:hypothetical protein